jgi:hypothetical protein
VSSMFDWNKVPSKIRTQDQQNVACLFFGYGNLPQSRHE